jgi:hypothetical protein
MLVPFKKLAAEYSNRERALSIWNFIESFYDRRR